MPGLSPEAQRLWNWISKKVMDPARTDWCRAGTKSGPTYDSIVNEPVVVELVEGCFGGWGKNNAIEFSTNGQSCELYAVRPQQKPDKERGWMMNIWLRFPESRDTLRVNLHVHMRMAERMAPVADAEGFAPPKTRHKKVKQRTY